MLIDLSPGRHVRWRPPSVNTSDDQSFPQLSGVRLSPLFLFPRTIRSPVESGMKRALVYKRSIDAILQAGSFARLMKWRDFVVLTCNI